MRDLRDLYSTRVKETVSKIAGSACSRKTYVTVWICAIALVGVLIAVGYMACHWGTEDSDEKESVLEERGKIPGNYQRGSLKEEVSSRTGEGNRVAFVIDDMGYDISVVHKLLALGIPVTISILPHLPYSEAIAREAYRAGREVMLHLPMEPHGYPEKKPGSGNLRLAMQGEELRAQLENNIRSVPHISGVNNHMGSRFMEDAEKVGIVLRELKRRRLFFLDSLTTQDSKGLMVAKRIGLPHVGRDIFLDNEGNFEDSLNILHHIIERRNQWKTMVIIGHPYDSTVRAIGESMAAFRRSDIRIVPLSELIN